MKKLIISAIGQDQPGIVAAVTRVFFDNQCNLEDTSMTLLEDQFTMFFIVEAPLSLTVSALESKLLQELEAFHLQLAIHIVETESNRPVASGSPWLVTVTGADQTGIMYHITQYLADYQVNIRHLSSKKLIQPDGPLYLMSIELDVPDAVDPTTFESGLKALGQREKLDVHAEALDVYTL